MGDADNPKKRFGDSVMMADPPTFLEELKINTRSIVDVALLDACLVIKPTIKLIIRPVNEHINEPIIVPILEPINEPVIEAMIKPQYTLADLWAISNLKAKMA